jgi:tetratricopeptide (TPR) repeat protein
LLFANENEAARAAAQAALGYDFEPARDNAALLHGIALLRLGSVDEARAAFTDALNAADALLASTPDTYDELDSRALSLCGLAVTGDAGRVTEASEAFRAARAVTRGEGVVAQVLQLFDALAACDESGVLAPVRPAAAGAA